MTTARTPRGEGIHAKAVEAVEAWRWAKNHATGTDWLQAGVLDAAMADLAAAVDAQRAKDRDRKGADHDQ